MIAGDYATLNCEVLSCEDCSSRRTRIAVRERHAGEHDVAERCHAIIDVEHPAAVAVVRTCRIGIECLDGEQVRARTADRNAPSDKQLSKAREVDVTGN